MHDVLFLDRAAVRAALDMAPLVDAMAEALAALSSGGAENPLRQALWRPDRVGLLGLMPAYVGSPASFVVKVVTVFPGAHAAGFESHQGAVLLFEGDHGQLLAVLEASELTARRTAAVSALSTRLLARRDAGDVAILGAGVQAWNHLLSFREVTAIRRVRIWNRTAERAERLAERARRELGLATSVAASAEAAVDGADLVATTTSSPEPVLRGAWLAPGAHVVAVGACTPKAREVDGATIARSRVYVDSRVSAAAESGELRLAREEGAIDGDPVVAELGELVLGRGEGRRSDTEITFFESLGVGVEDLFAARLALKTARERGLGRISQWTAPPAGEP